MKGIKQYQFLLKPFLILTVFYLVGILAIILSGVHFADDVARTNFGYAGWNGFSRYVSTVTAYGLHTNTYLANIAPLPQIVAVLILAFASLLLICLVTSKEIFKKPMSAWIWHLIAVVPLGLSPYMLECLSYQYDAPYMAISILFAILPLIFAKEKWWKYGITLSVSILIICMTYQAAIGIIPMLVIFMAIKWWNESAKKETKEIIKFVAFSAVVFLVTLVIFQKFLMKSRDAYVSTDLPEISQLIPQFFSHLGKYFSLLFSDFRVLWLVLIAIILVSFVVVFIIRSKKNRVAAGAVAVISIVLMAVLAFAFYAVLEKPLYATRAMYGIGAFIAIVAIYVVDGKCREWVFRIPVVALTYCFVVFAMIYGNALREQNNYRNEKVAMVISDLNQVPEMRDGGVRNIKTSGSVGLSPVVEHMSKSYPMIKRLLAPTYSEFVPWMAYQLLYQSGIDSLVYEETKEMDGTALPVLKETVFYRIKGDDKNVMVEFKGENKLNVIF